jgi:hypothetical protein
MSRGRNVAMIEWGVEYRLAECACGRARSTAPSRLDRNDTPAHFGAIRLGNKGIFEPGRA